jgi:SAM-dependent methyltransferase
MSEPMLVFDRRILRTRRARAATQLDEHGFLFAEVADRLLDRLSDVQRSFPHALDLGSRGGVLGRALAGRGGIAHLVSTDLVAAMLPAAGPRLVADPEFLPFAPASFDLVLSNLDLHWVNDLPGTLLQLRRALKPDGLLLAAMLGGETLVELRDCLVAAELAVTGGVHPRVSPFADVRDMGGLMQRAGFALPVVDADRLTVTYPDALALMRELRGMGESNLVRERPRGLTRRAVLLEAARLYGERHAEPGGRVRATFQVIYLTGWAPHESQPQALRRGSAAARLADALGVAESSAGERAGA